MFKPVLLVVLMVIIMVTIFCQPAWGAEAALLFVKIGLVTDQSQILLNVADIEGIFDLSSLEPVAIPVPGDQVVFTAIGDLIALDFLPISNGPLVIIPSTKFLSWNTRNYRGEFLIAVQNNKLTLINRLPLDDYLRGVVPREVMADWPMTTLKAQAIAARTYTVASLGRHTANNFDLCPTDHCQVYGGADAEKPNTDQAIASTAGEIITYRGKIISALYHSASGGSTADPADVWSISVPYLRPVIDWDQNSPYVQWTKNFAWEDLQAYSSRVYPKIGRLKQIQVGSFSKDGKLQKIILNGDLAEAAITGEQFRSLLGLPSSKIQIGVIYGPEPFVTLWWVRNSPYPEAIMANNDIPGLIADLLNPPWDLPDPWSWLQDKEPVRIVIKGSGWGHGVGLSQWGAKGMADNGYNEQQILAHFYPDTTISRIGDILGNGSRK